MEVMEQKQRHHHVSKQTHRNIVVRINSHSSSGVSLRKFIIPFVVVVRISLRMRRVAGINNLSACEN
jgi:hypothetical protein